jgi:hypothetical protein
MLDSLARVARDTYIHEKCSALGDAADKNEMRHKPWQELSAEERVLWRKITEAVLSKRDSILSSER